MFKQYRVPIGMDFCWSHFAMNLESCNMLYVTHFTQYISSSRNFNIMRQVPDPYSACSHTISVNYLCWTLISPYRKDQPGKWPCVCEGMIQMFVPNKHHCLGRWWLALQTPTSGLKGTTRVLSGVFLPLVMKTLCPRKYYDRSFTNPWSLLGVVYMSMG